MASTWATSASCCTSPEEEKMLSPKLTQRPKILLLGDSLTQTSFEGWGAHVANVYQRRADVLNRGYSGYNTDFLVRLWPTLNLAQEGPLCLAIIFLGANDAALPEMDAHHHVPLPRFRQNLHTLIESVQNLSWWSVSTAAAPACPGSILLLTPPPVHHQQRLAFQVAKYGDQATGQLERTMEHTGQYAAACRQVAQEHQLPYLDLYEIMQRPPRSKDATTTSDPSTISSSADSSPDVTHYNAEDPQDAWGPWLSDGLHFSRQGHELVGSCLVEAIGQHFPWLQVQPDPRTGQWANSASVCAGLTSSGPYHDEIDHKNLEAAFRSS